MKILLLTYPVSPYRGSEYSVSWNYIVNMSKQHELFVLYGTSGNGLGNVSELKDYLSTHNLDHVHFIDVQMPDNLLSKLLARLRAINYKYGSYIQYKYWHKYVYRRALEIVETCGINIIHYLNPIGFKEPSECWRIKGLPYVWGPVQGVENRPLCLYKALGVKGTVDAVIRLLLHNGILLFSLKIRRAVKRADCIFAATPVTVKQMKHVFGKDSIYLPENGITEMHRTTPITYDKNSKLQIVWCGAISYRKGLILLLEALHKVHSKNWHLNVIGDGELLPKLKKVSESYCLADNISWFGQVPRTKVLEIMSKSHLHIISSLGEATTTVLFEAMSWAVPTMTLDHCGMSGVVCNKCGIKIPIHSYNQVVKDIAGNIENIFEQPNIVNNLSSGVLECSKKYLWENRINIFSDVYSKLYHEYQDKG